MKSVQTNITIQDFLRLENPNSEVIRSGKILMCKLMQMDEDLHRMYANDKVGFHYYISHWSNSNKRSVDMLHDNPKADYVMFFIQDNETSESRFVGVYKMCGVMTEEQPKEENTTAFDFREVKDFENLKGRLVVNWVGQATMQYWYKNGDTACEPNYRYVVKINDIATKAFTTYEDVVLGYDELKGIIISEDEEWKYRLSLVNCIYGIVKKDDGRLYVGSTYSSGGIWNRWKDYAETGHGGNDELKRLIQTPDDAKDYQWTILEVLPLTISDKRAIERENFYKEKFCSRNQLNRN